jgi:hypothetical protein
VVAGVVLMKRSWANVPVVHKRLVRKPTVGSTPIDGGTTQLGQRERQSRRESSGDQVSKVG